MNEIETYHKPKKYTPDILVYWEPFTKELVSLAGKEARPLIAKARRFLEEDCIKRLNPAYWECGPIKGYNKTTYIISHNNAGFMCNCQGFNKRREEGTTLLLCSHILAVKQFEFMEANNG